MKNIINYYYNLHPEEITNNNDNYFFFINGTRYCLTKYQCDIEEIYKKSIEMIKKGIYIHPIIPNKDGKIYTIINKEVYILMQTLYYGNKVDLNLILPFTKITIGKRKNNWAKLWSEKNDYLEYQIENIKKKYPLLKESFDYFLYSGETAISLVNMFSKEDAIYTYAHKRISKLDTTHDLYNPLNIIEDLKVRDPAEYFKNSFFKGENTEKEIYKYIKKERLTKYEYIMFLARLMYPTYFFDIYEEIITGKKDEKEIKKIINKIDTYEIILKKIYTYYKSFINIPEIELLEKN